jgi:hypothetical protein
MKTAFIINLFASWRIEAHEFLASFMFQTLQIAHIF